MRRSATLTPVPFFLLLGRVACRETIPALPSGPPSAAGVAATVASTPNAVPLPSNEIILLQANPNAEDRMAGGINAATHIVVDPSIYTQLELLGAEVVAHEVGHYYWGTDLGAGGSVGPPWLNEGGSDFLAAVLFSELHGVSLDTKFRYLKDVRLPDCAGRGITRVEQLVDPELDHGDHQSRPYYDCYYALGEHLFQNLYSTIGPDNFRQAWTDLYLLSRSEARQLRLAEAELDPRHELTESEIYAAFLEHTPAGAVAAFRHVYQELYGADVPE